MIRSANHIVDLGPGAGNNGGEIVSQGDLESIIRAKKSLTADYLNGKKTIKVPKKRIVANTSQAISINNACKNNLKS